MRDVLNRNAGAISVLALMVALIGACIAGASAAGVFVTSKQIKNGTITAKDLRKGAVNSKVIDEGAVKSTDIGAGAVQSSDIGDDQVTPSDLALPSPSQFVVGEVVAPVGPSFALIATAGTYQKAVSSSTLRVDWSGAVAPGPGTNCVFQLRANGQPPQGGGQVVAQQSTETAYVAALFPGVPAGPVTIEVWARWAAQAWPTPSCVLNPSNPGIASTFIASELVS